MEINMGELRRQKRPLWMSPLNMTSFAEFLGAGGDIYSDRLWPEWERQGGLELVGSELEEAKKFEPEYVEGIDVVAGGEEGQGSIVEEAFMYVHQTE